MPKINPKYFDVSPDLHHALLEPMLAVFHKYMQENKISLPYVEVEYMMVAIANQAQQQVKKYVEGAAEHKRPAVGMDFEKEINNEIKDLNNYAIMQKFETFLIETDQYEEYLETYQANLNKQTSN